MPLLVYDGDCSFCTSSARWIAAAWARPARAVASQRLDAAELDRLGLTVMDTQQAVWWIDEHGRRFRGHLAIGRALEAADGWRRAVGRALLSWPLRSIGPASYSLIARFRHRLPGGTAECRTVPPQRSRAIE